MLIVLNPKISYFEEKNNKIAVVFDLSKSSKWLLDFYKSIDTKNYDKFELGDSIYKFKNFEFKYNITNLNALSYLKNYDKIVYVGDGWHNYPSQIDYNNFNSPVYVIYPNVKFDEILIKNFIYSKNVFPSEMFQSYLEIFSNKDTSINLEISIDSFRISRNINLKKGINSQSFILKAPSEEGYYRINIKFLDKQKNYPLIVESFSKLVLINVYKVNPEIGLLYRVLKDMGYEVILNLKNEKINRNFILTIGYGKDNNEDLIFLSGNKKPAYFKLKNFEIDSISDFKVESYIIMPISGIYKNRVFVLTDELWKIGRNDFIEYKNLISTIINTAINLKPLVNVNYNVVFNKVYLKISSNNPDIKFYNNNKEIQRYNVFEIKKVETLNLSGYLDGRKVYERKIIIKPDTLGFENEEGIDSITLSNLVNKTGGKFIKSVDELKGEKVRVQKEIFNNLFFGFLVIFLIILDIGLRRFLGFK